MKNSKKSNGMFPVYQTLNFNALVSTCMASSELVFKMYATINTNYFI